MLYLALRPQHAKSCQVSSHTQNYAFTSCILMRCRTRTNCDSSRTQPQHSMHTCAPKHQQYHVLCMPINSW